MPSGKVQPEFVMRLHEMGEWMRKNGESIYATRGGPVTPRPWGVTTQTKDKIFVHVLDWNDKVLALPKLPEVRGATLLASGKPVELRSVPNATLIVFPSDVRDPIDTVVVLQKAK
jgi:alpha-L-fucosidase